MGVTIAVSMRPKGAGAGSLAGIAVSLIYRTLPGEDAAAHGRHGDRWPPFVARRHWAPPSHTWRGLSLLSGGARGWPGSDTPALRREPTWNGTNAARCLRCFHQLQSTSNALCNPSR